MLRRKSSDKVQNEDRDYVPAPQPCVPVSPMRRSSQQPRCPQRFCSPEAHSSQPCLSLPFLFLSPPLQSLLLGQASGQLAPVLYTQALAKIKFVFIVSYFKPNYF